MEKIEFKNLPDTSTPFTAENFNQLQSNVEDAINGIVESGSNTNGEWTKWANGTMICTKRLVGRASLNLWNAPIIFADIPCGNFSQTFTTIQSIQATSENNQVVAYSITNFTTTSAGTIRITGCASVGMEKSYILHIFAIGRWK